jgi:hypothetical protein
MIITIYGRTGVGIAGIIIGVIGVLALIGGIGFFLYGRYAYRARYQKIDDKA